MTKNVSPQPFQLPREHHGHEHLHQSSKIPCPHKGIKRQVNSRPSTLNEADMMISCADLETKASLKSKHSEMSEEEQVRHHQLQYAVFLT